MDFIPRKRADRIQWWQNLSDNITEEGPKFGLTGPEAAAAKAIADDMLAGFGATDGAEAALDGARTTEKAKSVTNEAAIRAEVRNWKTRAAYAASGSEGVLKLKGAATAFDPATFKTVLKVTVEGGVIKIAFTKGETDGVVIYTRLRGTMGWTKLALDTDSPYYDSRPLATPGAAEVREYMGRGVVDDVEIGVDSDIVSVAFGG